MTLGPISARPLEWNPPKAAVSRVPYLPGMDGMRALAVVAVMVYHANNAWLPGGFIGVEVFFVISGYLITLLLIGEHERTGRIALREFWLRRARRLLPALYTMMALVVTYTALFERERLGKLRGDVIAGLLYVSNWYQIWVGQGYTSRLDWVPLRHLWSLAVEEQFYLAWPLIIVGLMALGRRRLPQVAVWLVGAAVLIAVVTTALYYPGRVGLPEFTPDAYWTVAGRSISKNDALYLSTITRATGLLLGAAFAMVWRPVAVMRGPMRDKGRELDLIAGVGLGVLVVMALSLHVAHLDGSGDARLFRGGFLAVDLATRRGDGGRDAPTGGGGSVARHPRAPLDRHPLVRALPLSLADLPDDEGPVRCGAQRRQVRRCVGADGAHHRGVVPLHRDPDPSRQLHLVVAPATRWP